MKSDTSELIGPMCAVIQHYQNFMVKTRYPKDRYTDIIWKQNHKAGYFGFVPGNEIIEFTRAFKAVFDYLTKKTGKDSLSFLDAGCGVGNMLLIAYSVGFDSLNGIELDEKTARMARKLLKRAVKDYTYKIVKADLTKHDKYKDYDVIYYFRPMHSKEAMIEFLNLLRKNMKVGAIVITNGPYEPFWDDKKFKQILTSLDIHQALDGIYEKIR
jgi:SAM-dependent methyltransferase